MIKLQAQVTGISTKVDGSIKITSVTRELPGSDAAELLNLRGKEIWQLIDAGETNLTAEAIPQEAPKPGVGSKTPSQRLRAVIFVWWQQEGKDGDFEVFYNSKMEQLIDFCKAKLHD